MWSGAVQRLMRACEALSLRRDINLLNPAQLTPETVAPVLAELRKVSKEDLGLHEPWHWTHDAAAHPPCTGLLAGRPPETYYYHIAETDGYSIGVFVLPPGAALPTHDHPHMCVLSKVLYGDLRVWSYDWAGGPLKQNRREGGAARVVDNGALYSQGMTKSLFPQRGNMHRFHAPADAAEIAKLRAEGNDSAAPSATTAVGCAILDVILPPYDERAGRDCAYFAVAGDDGASSGDDNTGDDNSGDTEMVGAQQQQQLVQLYPTEPEGFYVENLN